jgi:hypothetical protein
MSAELVKTALIGTNNAGPAAFAPHAVDSLVAPVGEDRESALLLNAAARSVYDRCGRLPRVGIAAIEPAPADAKQRAAGDLLELLHEALAGKLAPLVVEFLGRLESAGLLAPVELLPELLDAGDPTVRRAAAPVLGERGRWLSRFQERWSWAIAAADSAAQDVAAARRAWDEGALADRCTALGVLRKADPAAARELLAAALGGEKADHRAQLLEALQMGISPPDEPLLEQALDDRSSSVRVVAARLLTRIRKSALSQRMRDRADAMLVAVTKGMFRKKLVLTCSPPEETGKEAERDGLPTKAPAGQGLRACLAENVLAAVPPSHWCERFAAEPPAILSAIADDPFADAVFAGWTRAAAAFAALDRPSANWLEPLAEHSIGIIAKADRTTMNRAVGQLDHLLAAMNREQAERVALELLDQDESGLLAARFTANLPRPWSARLSSICLAKVRKALRLANDDRAQSWSGLLAVAALAIPPEAFYDALSEWEIAESDTWQRKAAVRAVEQFTEIVQRRRRFYNALTATKST